MLKKLVFVAIIFLTGCSNKNQHTLPTPGTPIKVIFDYPVIPDDDIPRSVRGKFIDMDSDWLIMNVFNFRDKTYEETWFPRKSIREIKINVTIDENSSPSLPNN